MTKSRIVREYAAKHPEQGRKAIAAAPTKRHGVEFTPASVNRALRFTNFKRQPYSGE